MRTVYADQVGIINLGYQSENDRTQVVFDISTIAAEFPGGLASIIVRRPLDTTGHLASGVVQDGHLVTWTVSDYELEKGGTGKVQLVYAVEGVTAKTKIWDTNVQKSICASHCAPPDWHDMINILLESAGSVTEAIKDASAIDFARARVIPLLDTEITKYTTFEIIGIPPYVSDVTEYADYGLTEAGWYLFVRIKARDGVTVGSDCTIEGASGIVTSGADHVDLAVRFDVAASSQKVVINWGDDADPDTFVFKATDLAVRNLDYRTTFYVYDIAPFTTWEFALTSDATFAANKHYYIKNDAGEYIEAVVESGAAVPAYYKQVDSYALTSDETFQAGVTYYTLVDGEYVAAEVTVGEAVPADTYYVKTIAYVQAEDGTFQTGVTYYTKVDDEYVEAPVMTGYVCPAYYNHSKVTFSGMTRNVTYRLNEMIDCPLEIVLPVVPDDGYGAWFEIQLQYDGSYSTTLLPTDETVKIGTASTQSQTAGINVIDLQYSDVNGLQIWTLLNTHTNIPT